MMHIEQEIEDSPEERVYDKGMVILFIIHKSMFIIRYSLSLFLAVILLAGCETVVEVPVPPHEPQLVAQSFFSPGSPWSVRVTNSVGYSSPDQPGLVDDATVEIWAGKQLIERLARSNAGTYASTAALPQAGTGYTLRIAAPGYTTTEGYDALPAPVPVTHFQETIVQEESGGQRRIVNLRITLADPADEDNFYGLGILQGRWIEDRRSGTVTLLPPSLFGFESDDPVFGESAFAFLDTEKSYYHEAFFSDDLFAGRTHTLDLDIQYDAIPPDAQVIVRRVFMVIVLSVSQDFFRYLKTASNQSLTNENPFAEPLRVHSNMTNGFGVFAGFQHRAFPLSMDSAGTGLIAPGDICRLAGLTHPICQVLPPP